MLTPICLRHCRWSLRMSFRRPIACLTLFTVAITSFATPAEAGPLFDWLFGHRTAARPAYPVGQPVPVGHAANMAGGYVANMPIVNMPVPGYPAGGYAANYGNYYGSMRPVIGPSGYGYPAPQPGGVAAAVAPSIMSYVPDYRTSQYRAPVTYYRPLMTTDPTTGSQVVALAPCTSYEYQTQRIPTFGYNGVMGSYNTPPVIAAPPTLPTYTLPSGGVPVATGGPAAVLTPSSGAYAMGYGSYPTVTPTAPAPSYSSSYGSYSLQQPTIPQQPTLTSPPNGTYSTQPLSSPPGYYGSVSGGSTGGSTGNYATPGYTPGLVAPPASSYPAPVMPSNSSPAFPMTPAPMVPAPGTVPRDPAGDAPPILPPISSGASNFERSQLRAIVRQPLTANSSLNSETTPKTELRQSQVPTMDPIPAPADFNEPPRWNPGLLNEQDRTASRPVAPNSNAYAGQSKAIQWASFKSESKPEPARQPSGLRAIAPSTELQPAVNNQPAQPAMTPRPARRQTGGWNVAK